MKSFLPLFDVKKTIDQKIKLVTLKKQPVFIQYRLL
jgi:hypothetical protein